MSTYGHPQWDALDVGALLRLPTALLVVDATNSVLSPNGAQRETRLWERGAGQEGSVDATARLVSTVRAFRTKVIWFRYEFFRDNYPATPMDEVQYRYLFGDMDWSEERKRWDSQLCDEMKAVKEPEDIEIVYRSFGNIFLGTPLQQILVTLGIRTLILTGYHLDECVEQAARTARDFGFMPLVASNCCLCTDSDDELPAQRRIASHWAPVLTSTDIVSLLSG
ncbi:MAG: cysteine hydrolase [Proteobacteria bacterium]|nr:MAG: cysteine hydrolase [Pseudomonadota bacterium]KAA3632811.1 MAG: cysteine hydrolase [Pseudomonadota bacterium]